VFRQLFPDSLIRNAVYGGFSHDHNIVITKLRASQTKAFTYLALYSVPLYSLARAFSRYNQAQARMPTLIGSDQERETRA